MIEGTKGIPTDNAIGDEYCKYLTNQSCGIHDRLIHRRRDRTMPDNGYLIYDRHGVTVYEYSFNLDDLAWGTISRLIGWDDLSWGRDDRIAALFRKVMRDAATDLGTVYANPRFTVVGSGPTTEFLKQARLAQRRWIAWLADAYCGSDLMRRHMKQRPQEIRQLELSGVLIVEGKHIRPDQWPTPSQPDSKQRSHNLAGLTFGRLFVVKRAEHGRWECRCKCGGLTTVRGSHLRSGRTKSCGCLRQELDRVIEQRKAARAR